MEKFKHLKEPCFLYLLKIGLVFLAITSIFNLAIYLSKLIPDGLPHLEHAIFGLVTTSLVILILIFAKKYSNPLELTKKDIRKDKKAFLIGILLFLIPASASLLIANYLNLVTISINQFDLGLLVNLSMLIFLVFISEALPEELIFRGYFYERLINVCQSKWITIGLQTILFVVFAFLIGATNSLLDTSFLVTFAIILGMCRALLESVWAPIGFHLTCMTFQQSFGENWDMLNVNNPEVLQIYVLGMAPLTVASIYLFTKLMNTPKE